jgi:hypothetical protein
VKLLLVTLVTVVMMPVQAQQRFTGTITDDTCAGIGHGQMRMDPSDAECARLCVISHGSPWVLEVGGTIYKLSDQTRPREFAARRVTVTGTLDARTNTIQVTSIRPAR